MNNSFVSLNSLELETPVDNTVHFREQESKLIKIVEALNKVSENRDWKYLQDTIFQGVVDGLKRERETQIERQPLNGPLIHNLNGQIKWAKKYLDLLDLASIYKQELVNVRKQLNANQDS